MQLELDQVVFVQSIDSDPTIPHVITDIYYAENSDIATIELDDCYSISAECISTMPPQKRKEF